MSGFPYLTVTIASPLLGVAAIALLPQGAQKRAKEIAVAASLLTLVLAWRHHFPFATALRELAKMLRRELPGQISLAR